MNLKNTIKQIEKLKPKSFHNIIKEEKINEILHSKTSEEFYLLQDALLKYYKENRLKEETVCKDSVDHYHHAQVFEVKASLLLRISEYKFKTLYHDFKETEIILIEINQLSQYVSKETLSDADLHYFQGICYLRNQHEHLIEQSFLEAIRIYDLFVSETAFYVIERLGYCYKFVARYYRLISDDKQALYAYQQAILMFKYLKDNKVAENISDEYQYQFILNQYEYLKIYLKSDTHQKEEWIHFILYLESLASPNYYFYLASTIYDYAEMVESDDPEEALHLFQKSLKYREIAATSLKDDVMIGFTELKMAKIYEKLKEMNQAQFHYETALDIFKKKSQNELSYQSEVAFIEKDLAFLHKKNKSYSDAIYHLFKALDAYERIAMEQKKYLYDVALCQYELGLLHILDDHVEDASFYFIEAASYFSTYYTKDLNRFAHYSGLSLFYAAKTCYESKRYDMVPSHAQAGIYVLKKLSEIKPKTYKKFLKELTFINACYFYDHEKEMEGIDFFKQSLNYFDPVLFHDIDMIQTHLSTYQRLIEAYEDIQEHKEAMHIRFDQVAFFENHLNQHKHYQKKYQANLLELITLLLEDHMTSLTKDLIQHLDEKLCEAVIYHSILMIYFAQTSDRDRAIYYFDQQLNHLSQKKLKKQEKLLWLILINLTFEHDDLYQLWENSLSDTILQTIIDLKSFVELEYQKEVLIESSICLKRYFEKTNQKNRIKEIEGLNL